MANEKIDGVYVELKADLDASGVKDASTAVTAAAKKIKTEFEGIETSAEKAGSGMQKQGKHAQDAGKNLGTMGRKAGMASIQIQQFTGQLSGGVNPLVAFSQQAADLGIVLGAPLIGSVVGIAAALAINFVPNMADAKSSTEKLTDSIETLDKTVKLGEDGILEFSKKIQKLSEVSKNAAINALEAEILRTKDAAILAAKSVSELLGELDAGYGIFGTNASDINTYVKALNNMDKSVNVHVESQSGFIETTLELGELLGKTGTEAKKLGREIIVATAELEKNPSFDNYDRYIKLLSDATVGNKKLSKETKLYISDAINQAKAGRDLAEKLDKTTVSINKLKEASSSPIDILGGGKKLSEIEEKILAITQKLAITTVGIDESSAAARRLAIAFELGKTATDKLPASIEAQLVALEAVEAKKVELDAADKKRDEGKKAGVLAFNEFLKSEDQSRLEQERKNADVRGSFGKLNTDLTKGTDLEQLEAKLIAEKELTAAYFELETASLMEGSAIKISLKEMEQQTITDIEKRGSEARIAIAAAERNANLNNAKSTFTNLASLMNTGSRKLFEIGKASAIAAATINGYQAVSKTMAETAAPWNIPLAIAQAASSAVQVQGIAKQKFGGGGGNATSFSAGVPAVNTQSGGAGGGGGDRNINIAGISANSLITGGQLVDTLNQALGDGYQINFAGG